MIQRSSNTVTRNVIIGSVIIIMLVTILYYMKRVEVGHLKKEMESLTIQRTDREDELNRKLTEYLQKLEDMTRQLGDINSRLQECEDNKAILVTNIQGCKSSSTECQNTRDALDTDLKASQAQLSEMRGQHDKAYSQLASHQTDITNVRKSLADAERELQDCEDEKETCLDNYRSSSTLLQNCREQFHRSGEANAGAGAGGNARGGINAGINAGIGSRPGINGGLFNNQPLHDRGNRVPSISASRREVREGGDKANGSPTTSSGVTTGSEPGGGAGEHERHGEENIEDPKELERMGQNEQEKEIEAALEELGGLDEDEKLDEGDDGDIMGRNDV